MNATTTPPPDNIKKYEADSWGKSQTAKEEEIIERFQDIDPKKAALVKCLINAARTYESDWDEQCEKLEKSRGCKLPLIYSNRINSRNKEQEGDCYRIHSSLK